MNVVSWLIVGACGLFFVSFIIALSWYLRVRRQLRSNDNESPAQNESVVDEASDSISDVDDDENDHDIWIALLCEQRAKCEELLKQYGEEGSREKEVLNSWLAFLDTEISLLSQGHNIEDTERLLDAFAPLVERLMTAQEVEMLLRKLSVNTKLLKQINKVVQKTGDRVFEQMNVTSALNLQLDKTQAKLLHETDLDQELAQLRAETASMYDLAQRLRRESTSKDVAHSDEFHAALDGFLNETLENDFLSPMVDEMDHKIADLKHLADYQSEVIASLKEQLKDFKQSKDKKRHIDTADIAVARMEKAMIENNKVIKSLESKLNSLQTIKHNLNIDAQLREAELRNKDAMLKEKQLASTNTDDWRDVIEKELSAMNNMEKLLSDVPLNAESQSFHIEQGGKVNELRSMVNESELYVEMLESDLDQLKLKKDELEDTLAAAMRGEIDRSQLSNSDARVQEEMDNLREVNRELTVELSKLERELGDVTADDEEARELQEMIQALDEKIETVQAQYVAMEEKYLNAMMSKE